MTTKSPKVELRDRETIPNRPTDLISSGNCDLLHSKDEHSDCHE